MPDAMAGVEAGPATGPRWQSAPVHLVALAGLAAYYAAVSWRRWPDPLIDFGNNLYVPWRMTQGAVLYRDVDSFYGPLSPSINAAIFALFGPGMMHLVWANLIVFGAILGTLYCLLRRAWGPLAALVASAVFVSVFGFSQFTSIGNYNYATPYSHEATHGVLVLLLLLAVLQSWLETARRRWEFLAGILFALSALLKPEIMLAALLLIIAAVVLQWRKGRVAGVLGAVILAAGAALPTLLFVGYFARRLSLHDAVGNAGHVWLKVTETASLAQDHVQIGFLGFDHPWDNFLHAAEATGLALALIAVILALGRVADRQPNWRTGAAIGVATVAGTLGIAWRAVPWLDIGTCLLGLVLLYLLWQITGIVRDQARSTKPALNLRLLLALLATALLARMALNGRIYQFGFYQAALAGTVAPAVLLGESAHWVRAGRRGQMVIGAGFLVLLLTGAVILTAQSQRLWKLKVLAVGEGADRFYAFAPAVKPTGDLVRLVTEALGRENPGQSLLVLPEGVMLNYLTRRPSPVPHFTFFGAMTENGRETRLVDELQRQPPDLVVILSRDLREHGIQRYGESVGKGELLLAWVSANYSTVCRIGNDPLDDRQFGAVVLRKNRTQTAAGAAPAGVQSM